MRGHAVACGLEAGQAMGYAGRCEARKSKYHSDNLNTNKMKSNYQYNRIVLS
jgi:hypothetical protein